MSLEKHRACPIHAVLKTALRLAATLWLASIAALASADDGRALDELYPDRTAGYVEAALRLENGEIEAADAGIAARSSSSRPLLDDWKAGGASDLRSAPMTTDPSDRIDRIMETYYPNPELRLSVGSGGTIGFAIDF